MIVDQIIMKGKDICLIFYNNQNYGIGFKEVWVSQALIRAICLWEEKLRIQEPTCMTR